MKAARAPLRTERDRIARLVTFAAAAFLAGALMSGSGTAWGQTKESRPAADGQVPAGSGTPAATPRPRPSPRDEEAARIYYRAGEQLYLKGKYADAIEQFAQAYRLSKAPALLYNLSQAHEKNGDPEAARAYLLRYVSSGDADASELSALNDKLDLLAARIRELPVPPPPPPPRGRFRLSKWMAAGGAVAAVATSTFFALDASSQAQKVEDAQNPVIPFDGDVRDAYDRGKRSQTIAWITGGLGAALVVGAATLFVLDRPVTSGAPASRTREPLVRGRVVPVLGPGYAGATATLRF